VVLARYAELLDLTSLKGVAAFEATAQRCFNERMSNVERVRVALKGDVAGRLKGRLNLDRVGVFGFSFGGSNALRLCSQNPAFHAGANEDGLFLGEEMPAGPFLFFDQEMPSWLLDPPSGEEDAEQSLIRRAEAHIQEAMHQSGRERVVLDGTRHLSFSDRIYTSPFPRLARVGRRSAQEVHEVLSTRLYQFFTAALGSSGQLEQTGGAE
jgi:dienelactone hydrolase